MKSQDSLFDAAIESARIFNHAVSEVATSAGLLTALREFQSVPDIVRRMDFREERADQLHHLLRMLAAEGVLEQREHSGLTVFRCAPAGAGNEPAARRYEPRYDQIDSWFGEGHSEKIRNANKQFLGADLSFLRSPDAAISFSRDFADAWRTNLQNPLYEFGRMLSVMEVARRGSRYLDLASGPGYGTQRLAEFAPGDCEIVCVDKSSDFLALARRARYPGARVTFIERDLNTGLPPLPPASFDGVLFVGAFHFISDKAARLREIWRALRPGGVLALGHCFSHSGFGDETMHDFYFSMISDRAYVLPWSTIKELVSEAGFAIYREFHRGSHSYLVAERSPDSPPATAMDGLRPEVRGGVAG